MYVPHLYDKKIKSLFGIPLTFCFVINVLSRICSSISELVKKTNGIELGTVQCPFWTVLDRDGSRHIV